MRQKHLIIQIAGKVSKAMRVLLKGYGSQPEVTFTAEREVKWSNHKTIIRWFKTLGYDCILGFILTQKKKKRKRNLWVTIRDARGPAPLAAVFPTNCTAR